MGTNLTGNILIKVYLANAIATIDYEENKKGMFNEEDDENFNL